MALTDNPMSLVVTGNVTIGAELEASVPTTETYLLEVSAIDSTYTITVPAGVQVLKIVGDIYHENEEGEVALDVYSVNGKKYWLSLWDYENAYGLRYIGVTPNKSYTLRIGASSSTGTESGTVRISYSQSINNQTPSVTDY